MGAHNFKTKLTVRRLALAVIASTTLTLTPSAYSQDSEVLARVNGNEITAADLAVAEEMYAQQLGQMPEDAKRSVLVDALIELRIISDAARAAGTTDQDAYKRQMAFFEAQTLRSVFLEQRVASAVTDAAVRAAYDEQLEKIPPIKERRLRHILLQSESEAQEIIVALTAGRPFSELAAERSADDVSKANGGDLGFVAEGQTLPEVDAAASALKPSEYTQEPVASAFGFHVVMLEEERNRPAPPFEVIAPQIRQSLESAEEQRIISEIRISAKVEKLIPDVSPPQTEDGHDH